MNGVILNKNFYHQTNPLYDAIYESNIYIIENSTRNPVNIHIEFDAVVYFIYMVKNHIVFPLSIKVVYTNMPNLPANDCVCISD